MASRSQRFRGDSRPAHRNQTGSCRKAAPAPWLCPTRSTLSPSPLRSRTARRNRERYSPRVSPRDRDGRRVSRDPDNPSYDSEAGFKPGIEILGCRDPSARQTRGRIYPPCPLCRAPRPRWPAASGRITLWPEQRPRHRDRILVVQPIRGAIKSALRAMLREGADFRQRFVPQQRSWSRQVAGPLVESRHATVAETLHHRLGDGRSEQGRSGSATTLRAIMAEIPAKKGDPSLASLRAYKAIRTGSRNLAS